MKVLKSTFDFVNKISDEVLRWRRIESNKVLLRQAVRGVDVNDHGASTVSPIAAAFGMVPMVPFEIKPISWQEKLARIEMYSAALRNDGLGQEEVDGVINHERKVMNGLAQSDDYGVPPMGF